jgi:alanine racemase
MLNGLVNWAEIDLDAIAANVRGFVQHCGADVEVIAVVKGNAYGHGAAQVARAALHAGATRLAVHRLGEGIQLRKAGIDAPVLLMGYTPPAAAPSVACWHLTPSLITLEFAQAFSDAVLAAGQQPMPVHLKVDTGMNRYGVLPDEALPLARRVSALPGLVMEGIFTHFATADEPDDRYFHQQLAVFQGVLAGLERAGLHIPLIHAANSAAAMRFPTSHFNAVRPGIALYGLDPSGDWPPVFPLRAALALKSRVARVRLLPPGAPVSYGGAYITQRPTLAALVPLGYGDGYHRLLSNRGSVLIGGRRAPIIGRICMDQFVADASAAPAARQDDEVVLIGSQGGETIRAEEVARLAGTINYEITTALLPRIPRVYLRGGQVVAIESIDENGE